MNLHLKEFVELIGTVLHDFRHLARLFWNQT